MYGTLTSYMIEFDFSNIYSYTSGIFAFLWAYLFVIPQVTLIFNAFLVYTLEAVNLVLRKYLDRLDAILNLPMSGKNFLETEIQRGVEILEMIDKWTEAFGCSIFILTGGFLYTEVISAFMGFTVFEVLYNISKFNWKRFMVGVAMGLIFLCTIVHQVKLMVQGQNVTKAYKLAKKKLKRIQMKYSK